MNLKILKELKFEIVKTLIPLVTMFLIGCYGVNSETSQIGNINSSCLTKNAWKEMQNEYAIEKITDSTFQEGLKHVENHFIKPAYVIYFQDEPKEIVGFDATAIRVVYNPKIAAFGVDGLSPQLSDKEQIRIRNRVLEVIREYACEEGKEAMTKEMNEPAIFSKAYYEKN
ncbi:MAG: hypothetical protein RL660_2335 [Bacteroidota bacterium]|jgi:hypothetical protein